MTARRIVAIVIIIAVIALAAGEIIGYSIFPVKTMTSSSATTQTKER